ncbi:MAG TPA: hypothetical protein VME67_19545 [Mycobacterium sp.]|nr:hypothetical protein [Mycobacterium sp.]HTX96852.1 hypothetical protein [Mycobacterium sp.]
MKLRAKKEIRGGFLNLEPRPPYGASVHVGDILEVEDHIAVGLIAEGVFEVTLTGEIGQAYRLTDADHKTVKALRAKLSGEKPPPPPEPGRRMTRAEKDALLEATRW